MFSDKEVAREIIKRQARDQGCHKDDIEDIALLQPHLYEWICFFGLEHEFASVKKHEEAQR